MTRWQPNVPPWVTVPPSIQSGSVRNTQQCKTAQCGVKSVTTMEDAVLGLLPLRFETVVTFTCTTWSRPIYAERVIAAINEVTIYIYIFKFYGHEVTVEMICNNSNNRPKGTSVNGIMPRLYACSPTKTIPDKVFFQNFKRTMPLTYGKIREWTSMDFAGS